VVVLSLAAALDAYVSARVQQATLIRARLQDSLDAYSTRATVLFLLGTQRFTRAGLTTTEEPLAEAGEATGELRIDPVGGEIALDGSPYAGMGRVRFSLQDEAGMVALNSQTPERLEGLLGRFDDAEASVAALLDTLADYRDSNRVRRLNGAEREEYAAAGLAPPSDRNLRSAPEITQVMGWREWIAAHPAFRLHEWLSPGRSESFNPNVVPASLLEWLPGLDPARAERIVDERNREPFRSEPDFKARVDVELPVAGDQYRFFPSDTLRLTLWTEGSAHAEMLAIQSTPLDLQLPWQIDSVYSLSLPPQDLPNEVPGQYFSPRAPATR
jgi:general secretion pathway protein K